VEVVGVTTVMTVGLDLGNSEQTAGLRELEKWAAVAALNLGGFGWAEAKLDLVGFKFLRFELVVARLNSDGWTRGRLVCEMLWSWRWT